MAAEKETCDHHACYKGTHPSFQKGRWLCADCGEFVNLGHLEGYGVVFMAIKMSELQSVVKRDMEAGL